MVKMNVLIVVMAWLAIALADVHMPQGVKIQQIRRGVAASNPYIFLTVPKERSQSVIKDYEVIEADDNENRKSNFDETEDVDENANEEELDEGEIDDDAEDLIEETTNNTAGNDDHKMSQEAADEEEEEYFNENIDEEDYDDDALDKIKQFRKFYPFIKNAKASQILASGQHQVFEIEGQSIVNEKTGKQALVLPRSVLESIPNGSIVSLLKRSTDNAEEARAKRIFVRRRRKGGRRKNKRRNGGNKRIRVIRVGGQNIRGQNIRGQNIRIIRRGNGNRRRGNRRVIYLQV